MAMKSNLKAFLIIIIVCILLGLCVNSFADYFSPSHANDVFEDIGGDGFLNATIKGCKKIDEQSIPDGKFISSNGEIGYYGAKNITYMDAEGKKGYIVVWKASPDKYLFDTSEKVNQYLSDYVIGEDEKLFIIYSYENNQVYGIVIGTGEIDYTEYQFLYDVLGLDPDSYDVSNYFLRMSSSTNYGSSPGVDHYHTVVPDRYTLSRTDPGSYYDHYEYGDNYDIDNYLESEGYD